MLSSLSIKYVTILFSYFLQVRNTRTLVTAKGEISLVVFLMFYLRMSLRRPYEPEHGEEISNKDGYQSVTSYFTHLWLPWWLQFSRVPGRCKDYWSSGSRYILYIYKSAISKLLAIAVITSQEASYGRYLLFRFYFLVHFKLGFISC